MTNTVSFVRFTLRLVEPGAVTVPQPAKRGEPDLVPDTDHRGRPHIPGTTLAGALRARVREQTGRDDTADAWFGHLLEVDPDRESADAVASRIWVLGTRLINVDGADIEHAEHVERWSTAIDRKRAAARAHTLRGRRLLAPGTRFDVFLRWDDAEPTALDELLTIIGGWQPTIGHAAARGHGRCVVHDLSVGTLDLNNPADLARWLTLNGPELVRAAAVHRPEAVANPAKLSEPAAAVDLPLTVTGPLHIGGGGDEPTRTDSDAPQVAALLTESGAALIPGTTLKGVIRSRVEYILRTFGVTPTPCEAGTCASCWPCQVFGHGGGTTSQSRAVGLRSRIRFHDMHLSEVQIRPRTHVAIDRFTGGARDRQLYTVEAVEAGRGQLIIEINVGDETRRAEIRALLRVVFEDLNDRLIGIGRATTRGYGSVQLDTSAAEATGALPTLAQARNELLSMTNGESRL